MENKYKKALIYRIFCRLSNKTYIGATCCTLKNKIRKHSKNFNKLLNRNNDIKPKYVNSFDVLKNNHYDAYEVVTFECQSKEEMKKKLDEYIEKCDCINKTNIYESCEDWAKKNCDYMENYNEMMNKLIHYNEMNKSTKRKGNVCDCGGKYTNHNKVYHVKTQKHKNYLLELKKNEIDIKL